MTSCCGCHPLLQMLSTKTYLLLNSGQRYGKQFIAITDRLLSLNANQWSKCHPMVMNDNKSLPFATQMRQLSDQKVKSRQRVDPIKVDFVDDEPRLSHVERLKRIIQNYGTTAVVLHIVISLTSLGVWYSVLYFGIDITSYIDYDYFGETVSKVMTGSGTFAVAYALHKMIMPLRVTATVILTPVVVRQLRKIGFIKKPHKNI